MYDILFWIIIILIFILVFNNFNSINYENFRFSHHKPKSSLPKIYKCPEEPSTYNSKYKNWLSCLVSKSLKLYEKNKSEVSEQICHRLQSKQGSKMIEEFLVAIGCIGGYESCSRSSTAKKNAKIFAGILDHSIQSSGYHSKFTLSIDNKWSKIRDLFLTQIYHLMFKKYQYPGAILVVELYKLRVDPKWLIDLILVEGISDHIFHIVTKIPVSESVLFRLDTLLHVIMIGKSGYYNSSFSVMDSNTKLLNYILISPVIKDAVEKYHSAKLKILKIFSKFSPAEVQRLDHNLYKKIDPDVNELLIKAFPNLKIPRKGIEIKSE